ncbi:cation transporter [Vibrio bivalvicida]|uniref:Cation transporter n=1 Tax=Vibrio bivalvicida TaxID=1276888 RepID=A0ABV4MIB9_9VIBR
MKDKIAVTEKRALVLGIIANLIMAFSGWAAYNLSGSEALLLDGNMSFILFITAIVALKITQIKSLRNETYPFGLYVTEALYSFMKGLLLLGVVISAIVSNGSKIISYINGATLPIIKTSVIVYYAIAMVTICWGLSAFYYFQNKKIANSSSMLKVDQKSSLIDGVLSASTGAVLVVIGYVEAGSKFDFLLYIGDALLVLTLALLMIGQPIGIIREAFVELAGGKLQNEQQHQDISNLVTEHFAKQEIERLNISKTGSSYLVVIGVSLQQLQQQDKAVWHEQKAQLTKVLVSKYPFVDVEVVVV